MLQEVSCQVDSLDSIVGWKPFKHVDPILAMFFTETVVDPERKKAGEWYFAQFKDHVRECAYCQKTYQALGIPLDN